ncbi:hypothetical protein JL721_12145 [Aureococcus anophagefferens]|nr:hypothetical protein JL721_12145 [Aureococcus anophagefferens]
MPTPEEMDEMFMHTAQRCGGIEPLLESFFGFLKRRTDFYVVHDGKENTRYEAGFGPGKAEAMVRSAFGKHALKPLKGSDIERSAEARLRRVDDRPPRTGARKPPPPPVPAKPASGADGQFDGTLAETTVTVDAPPGTRSKDVTCKITAGRISKNRRRRRRPAASSDKIKDDDSMWTLDHADDGRAAVVLTSRRRARPGGGACSGRAKRDMIDATQVDSSKKIDEYDEKTQGAIRKIMFDQRQKQKGEDADEMKMDAISTAEPGSRSWTPRAVPQRAEPEAPGA